MYSIAHHLLAYLNLIYVYPYQFHGKALTNYKFHVLNKRITLKHLLVLNFISYTLLARMIKIVLAMFNVETSQLRGFLCFGVNEISVPLHSQRFGNGFESDRTRVYFCQYETIPTCAESNFPSVCEYQCLSVNNATIEDK